MAGLDILVIAALGSGGLYSSAKKRHQMKLGDEEIKKEGEKERKTELERALDVEVKHHKHHHPLNEVDGDQEFVCGGCARPGKGRRYRCCVEGCGFEMHRVCASTPVMLVGGDFQLEALPETVETFAHREDGHVLKKDYGKIEMFDCAHCCNVGKGFRYRCESEGCLCTLHPICAKSPTRINSFMHPEHELVLITRPYFANCSFCNRGRKSNINNRVYTCKACKFYLHPTCSLWPQYLFHELHVMPHPLQLKVSPSSSSSSSIKCSACKEKSNGSVLYRCESCYDHESYHPLCLLRSSNNAKADEKSSNAFKKEVANQSEFRVEFAGIEHLGIIG